MAETVVKVEFQIVLTDKDIDDIMACALEGGITYWCDEAEVIGDYLGEYASDQISRGGKLKVYDYEGEEEYILTKEKFIEGLKKYLRTPSAAMILYSEGEKIKIDTCNIDAGDADAILQMALFGEIVYG